MIENAIARLLKVLALEQKQGCRNKAVIGGLDKFVSRWEPAARAETTDPAAISEIVALLLGYPTIEDAGARGRILDQVIRRAVDLGGGASTVGGAPPIAQATHPAPGAVAEEVRAEKPHERDIFAPAASKPTPPMPAETSPAPPSSRQAATPAVTHPHSPAAVADAGSRRRGTAPAASSEPRPQAGSLADQRPTAPPSESWPAAPAPAAPMPAETHPSAPVEARPIPIERPQAEREPREPGRPTAPSAPPPPPRPTPPEFGLDAPVTRLPGIGPSYAQKLSRLGVHTVRDLLYLLPRRYDDFTQLCTIDKLKWGEEVTVIGTVWNIKTRVIGEDRRMVTAVVGDGTGEMQMTWFNPYVERRLRVGHAYAFSGKVDAFRSYLVIRNPEFEPLDRNQLNTGRLAPVYPLTEGLSVQWMRGTLKRTVDAFADQVPDFLPEKTRSAAGLVPLAQALAQIHFPDNRERLAAAQRRLSFGEFFVLQLGFLAARQRFRGAPTKPLRADPEVLAPFLNALPFAMTAAQRRTLDEITVDLCGNHPMSRLLQGDVGSGKTAVAAAALWAAVANGTQGAIMAPTEILAEQHARAFGRMLAGLTHPLLGRPLRIILLTGSIRPAERAEALAALAEGKADIAVGTHALIQSGVSFRELTVAVVDEQHRFGVEQRAALRQKGMPPHMLVMSATPIPRSLALTVYGDLDVSVIDEMPAGRAPIKTKWLSSNQRERAYDFIRRQVAEGRQAFIIYPLVEESASSDARAAVEEHTRLKTAIFPDMRVGLLHGRMRGEEKDRVMRAFGAHELDVLVATSVVEVGIDVPNATVIVIEGAEHFGLAQLHQFRGRVGRGQHPSYCILISDASEGESIKRLQAIEKSTDGFALAQIDLELRGPGDFFGTRQSGLPPLQTATLSDLRTLEDARAAAQELFAADPGLTRPEHRLLAAEVAAFWQGAGDVS